MAKNSVTFACRSCGYNSGKWLGRCPSCDEWGSFIEEIKTENRSSAGNKRRWVENSDSSNVVSICEVGPQNAIRLPTGIGELDRTLGGGIVPGSMTLIGGDPGIGKSTLLLQVAGSIAKSGRVLYVSGEESPAQIKLRGDRLGVNNKNVLILPETELESIVKRTDEISPSLVIVDSIQTIFTQDITSAPGSVAQIRESTALLLAYCKKSSVPIVLIGHVTKEGAIAGPRLLEHMVDTVLYFEGEKSGPYRILRGVKNRFGSTSEIGLFEMRGAGLVEVTDPSKIFLSHRNKNLPGSAVVVGLTGTRAIMVEIEALVSATHYPSPRRTAVGLDGNRVAMLLAIIEKRAGFHLLGDDLFVNVAGGLKMDETAIDLGVAGAIVSSFRNAPIVSGSVAIGELALSGEIRGVDRIGERLSCAKNLGFTRAVVPTGIEKSEIPKGMEILSAPDIETALDYLLVT